MRISKYRDATVFRLNVRGGAGPVDPGLAEDDKPGVQYRRLFRGDPDRPGNFEMVVLRSPRDDASIHFPRHRHDFDQVRLTLAGNPAWAPQRKVPPGSVVYTAAGTFYGPYDRFADEEQLHIQFEGANHARFLDYDTFADARRRMSRDGRFERGVYITAAADGRETKVDAHQAVMEFLTGAPVEYPRSRYTDSVQIDPAPFAWDAAGPGARTKQLGTFTECLTALWMAQIDAGARYSFAASPQTRLVFVQDGTGAAEGEEIGPRDGLLLAPGETGAVAATSTLTLFVLTLPKTGDQTTTEEAEAA